MPAAPGWMARCVGFLIGAGTGQQLFDRKGRRVLAADQHQRVQSPKGFPPGQLSNQFRAR